MTIDSAEAEKGLLEIVAGWTSLVSGVSIFRGQIPDGKAEGVAVALLDDISGNTPELPLFNAQVYVKRTSRDAAREVADLAMANLPAFGVSGNGVAFNSILRRGGAAMFQVADDGEIRHVCTINLAARFYPAG
jgi:hypothetical protein